MLKVRPRRDARSTELYQRAVERSRQPELYAKMGAPDTVEGRFELLTAHIYLIIERLNREGDIGKAAAQSLFDLYIRNLDSALREMGVGDLAVGKRMKSLGQIFYGRATAYETAFQSNDVAQLEDLISRTLLTERPGGDARAIATYLREERARLADVGIEDLGRDAVNG